MKNIAIAAVATAFALAGCGGAPSASSTTTPAAQTNAPAATATQAAPTGAATQAPAASAAAGPARKVAVTATNSLYSIATLEVKAGEKIEFVLTNNGDEKHNMVGVGQDISLVSPDFDAGQTISWIWTAPAKAGTFKLQCSYHKDVPPVVVTVK